MESTIRWRPTTGGTINYSYACVPDTAKTGNMFVVGAFDELSQQKAHSAAQE